MHSTSICDRPPGDKAQATVTANSGRSTYNGQTQSVSGFTATGLVGGETAEVLANVSASGSDKNYALTFVDGSLTIDKAALQISGLQAADKVFDGTTVARIEGNNLRLLGLVAGEQVVVVSTGEFADATPGTGKLVRLQTSVSGPAAVNYTITPQTSTIASISASIEGPTVLMANPTSAARGTAGAGILLSGAGELTFDPPSAGPDGNSASTVTQPLPGLKLDMRNSGRKMPSGLAQWCRRSDVHQSAEAAAKCPLP